MGKLTILKGLPASGKSTMAQELCLKNKKTARLNKDLLREMLHFGGYHGDNERWVVQFEYDMAHQLLAHGYNVVVDDTNLNPAHERKYREIAEPEHTVEVVRMSTSVDECILRDGVRKSMGQRFVGKDNILNMAFQFGLVQQHNTCVVFDMDGTLAEVTHRRHFVRDLPAGQKPDWDAFFKACPDDTPRQAVVEKLLAAKAAGHDVIVCSARPEPYRDMTAAWLGKYGIPYDRLIMRRNRDYRPDEIVKKEFLDKYLDRTKIVKVYDDRPKIVRMWRAEGLDCEDVGDGVEF